MLGALSSEFPFGATLICLDVWYVLLLVLQWLTCLVVYLVGLVSSW